MVWPFVSRKAQVDIIPVGDVHTMPAEGMRKLIPEGDYTGRVTDVSFDDTRRSTSGRAYTRIRLATMEDPHWDVFIFRPTNCLPEWVYFMRKQNRIMLRVKHRALPQGEDDASTIVADIRVRSIEEP